MTSRGPSKSNMAGFYRFSFCDINTSSFNHIAMFIFELLNVFFTYKLIKYCGPIRCASNEKEDMKRPWRETGISKQQHQTAVLLTCSSLHHFWGRCSIFHSMSQRITYIFLKSCSHFRKVGLSLYDVLGSNCFIYSQNHGPRSLWNIF